MKTSVIVPYHKGEAYLRDCLNSIIEHSSLNNIEILLICDHVSQEDLHVVDEYKEKLPLSIYELDGKTGVAAARNMGIAKATGDYVYFLDSDDYLYGNVLDLHLITEETGDYDIIYGKREYTWFQRSVYLAFLEKKSLNDEEASEEGESDTSEDVSTNSDQEDGFGEDTYDTTEDYTEEMTEEDLENEIMARKRKAYRALVSKRKGMRNISVLGIYFRRKFLMDNGILFPEKLKYFSDVPFLVEAMSKAELFLYHTDGIYIQRKHNDPINSPSLSQIKDPDRFYEFIDAYYETVLRIPEDMDLKSRIAMKYINYYVRVHAPKLKRSSNDAWRTDKFELMGKIARDINPEVIHKLKGYKKRIIKALIKNNLLRSLRIVKIHLGYKKLKKIVRKKKSLAKFLYDHIFLKQEVMENWILFESFFGKSYSGSPKYIYEYLAKNYPGEYKFIWVINKKTNIPYPHKKIKRFSIRYYYYLARCKYDVFNGRQPEWMVKREDNVFLETWHGTPLKKLVFDIDDISSATPKYKQQVYKQSRIWDYLIAPNAFSSETFRRCFMFEKEILETGYPRNDLLHSPNKDEIALQIRDRVGIPKNKKTILYAPTWRDDEFYAKGQYKFQLQLDIGLMKEQLGEEYVLLLRTHYFIADSIDVSEYGGFAYNVSKYDDITELYLISDILITDYSSVFFDYANLKRPMLFFTYDLEKYRDTLRGFYFDIEREVPGPLLYTTEEVIDAIKNIEKVSCEFNQRYEQFYQRFCEWEDGHAAEKVVKSVFKRNNSIA